jgi:hypothetical protein
MFILPQLRNYYFATNDCLSDFGSSELISNSCTTQLTAFFLFSLLEKVIGIIDRAVTKEGRLNSWSVVATLRKGEQNNHLKSGSLERLRLITYITPCVVICNI